MNNRLSCLALFAALALPGCDRPANDTTGPAAGSSPTQSDTTTDVPGNTPANTPADSAAPGATDPAAAGTAATPASDATAGTAADPAATKGDPVALGLLSTINQHEIDLAKQAKDKKVTGAVLEYAQMMEREHSQNQEQTLALGSPADTDQTREMKRKGSEEKQRLGALDGKDYAKAYVDAMVKGHTEALSALDATGIPAASSAGVREHLTRTRGHVATHLEKAKAIQLD